MIGWVGRISALGIRLRLSSQYRRVAMPSCRRLPVQTELWALAFVRASDGRMRLAKMATIAITTSNSISVKPADFLLMGGGNQTFLAQIFKRLRIMPTRLLDALFGSEMGESCIWVGFRNWMIRPHTVLSRLAIGVQVFRIIGKLNR